MIIFHFGEINTCGAVLQTFGIVEELKKRGIDTNICTNYRNKELEEYYDITPIDEGKLKEINSEDIIVANWWRDIPRLYHPSIKLIQWVRTRDDLIFGKEAIKYRDQKGWEYIVNSKYVGEWLNKPYTVIPNYVHPRFFKKHKVKDDIDILYVGNMEKNKRWEEALDIVSSIEMKITKTAWLGRQTGEFGGTRFENPNQEDIPSIYGRSKAVIVTSKSEGFSLPCLEAMASGSLLFCFDAGGNMSFCKDMHNCIIINEQNAKEKILITLKDKDLVEKLIENGYKTAKQYTIDNTVNKFLKYIK